MKFRLLFFLQFSLFFPSVTVWSGPALLFDQSDGKIFYAEDLDDQWHPASLTKIMTAYLTFKAIKAGKLRLDDSVICSEKAFQQPPSKIGLPIGGQLTVDQALQALIVKSANDVAMMLAEKIGGTEIDFVSSMNSAARDLGMTRSNFVNPNGLPAVNQITTARDLAKLSRAVIKEFPEYASYWSMTQVQLGKIRLASHNALLRTFDGADGLKTGFICDSGFNIVASATRDGHRLMAVVLGEPTVRERNIRAANLLQHGFQKYSWKDLVNNKDTIDTLSFDPGAKGVQSVRQTVLMSSCGYSPRAAIGKKDRSKTGQAKRSKIKSPAKKNS
ncbi:MAG: D-alanyl-D-alanine carboxypeptidase family protein [Hyphomicrobium sp.]